MALFTQAGLVAAGTQVSNREKIIYLKRYKWLDRRINSKLNQLEVWRSRLGKLTPTLSEMPGGGGSIYKSKDLDLIDKIVDIEDELDKEIDELILIKDQIRDAINSLDDDREKTLMQYRYIDGMKFEWIASTMEYHWRSIHKIHVRALNKIKIGQ